ncbi:MAG: response regulator [Chroococcidiopsidaceae cyanobacterium CP_BM_ER_R8_30]|nr:response regulator [Chroococcidiopsidaceae cyanobacterium CP_BM_ER_R8_30]
MVVDDEEDIQLLFKQQFRREIKKGTIKFSFTLSAEEALENLQGEVTDCLVLILADINMPGMNGLELLKIIKERYPHLKVFMITAYSDDRYYRIAKKYGADDYIEKPVEFDTLKEKILKL